MALTSQQKHYIKKNIKKLSAEEMAYNLNISSKEINRYTEKHWPKIKAKKDAPDGIFDFQNQSSFVFSKFIAENIGVFILLIFLVAASYANSIGNDFVSDDIAAISKNPNIGKFSYVFFHGFLGSSQNLAYYIIYHIGGTNPSFFRIFNIIAHAGLTVLLFTFLSLISKRNIAIIATVIFAAHPILTESITWISGMPYILHAFFFILSLFLFTLYKQRMSKKLLILSYFSFLLSLISTEKAIPLFVTFFFFEFVYGNLKRNWVKLTPFVILSFVWIITFAIKITSRTSALVTQFYQPETKHSVFIQLPVAIANYFKLLVWPQKLSLYQTEMNFPPIIYTFMLLIFLIYIGAIIFYWQKNKFVSFWLFFFILALSTTLTPWGVSWVVAERYAYLGSIGIFVVFAWFFNWLMENSGEKYKYVFYGTMVLIVSALSIRTIYRNMDWKNEDSLWIATAKVSPSGAPIHNNLGDVYARRKDYPKAIEEFTRATQINPGYADAYHNLANTYQMTGNASEAEKYYLKALSINPRIWQSHQNLAAIYFERGDRQKAQETIQKAIAINPNEPGLIDNMKIIHGEAPASISAPQPPAP